MAVTFTASPACELFALEKLHDPEVLMATHVTVTFDGFTVIPPCAATDCAVCGAVERIVVLSVTRAAARAASRAVLMTVILEKSMKPKSEDAAQHEEEDGDDQGELDHGLTAPAMGRATGVAWLRVRPGLSASSAPGVRMVSQNAVGR